MSLPLRFAGAGMALGGVLFFTRMAPIFPLIPEDMAFPPDSAKDLVRLAEITGALWPLSHAMGLAAVILFVVGYWVHAQALASAGRKIIGRAAAIIATLAFSLFAAALITDGFILSSAISNNRPEAAIAAIHADALRFFTPAIFTMFIAVGILSSRLLHGFAHSRWLGALGMAIAIAGPTAYLFGVTGPNWDNLQIGGSLMMLAFAWHLIVGVVATFGRGVRSA